FEEMANDMASKEISLIHVEELDSTCILLDTRSFREYEVSHIEGAIWVGYDEFEISKLASIARDKKVVVYCSVGYRSGKIGEKLAKAGYSKVYNLWGGIFDWVNKGNPVVNDQGKTSKIHGYNKKWGNWLTRGEIVYA
ncbi:MAG: rhodanese-like domain-containing protein, partial [Flavobacteriales bacterium]